jgi:hypothetical protein
MAMVPVFAPVGTVTVMLVAETTLNVVAVVPSNLTAVASVKFVPVIVTLVPTKPEVGENDVMVGAAAVTTKLPDVVFVPPGVVTLRCPVVAPVGTVAMMVVAEETVNEAVVPLNLNEVAPVKFVPVTFTTVPTGPVPGA